MSRYFRRKTELLFRPLKNRLVLYFVTYMSLVCMFGLTSYKIEFSFVGVTDSFLRLSINARDSWINVYLELRMFAFITL